MMLKELRKKVLKANLKLVEHGLVSFTWGNVSGIDRSTGLIVIKPSGVAYESMTEQDLVIVSLDGNVVEGKLNPSTDTPTHIALYKAFKSIGGVAHTHSRWATIWAQSGRGIMPYGTTHADFAAGPIPCTRGLTRAQVQRDYEANTGKLISEHFRQFGIDPARVPAVLVRSHGPFTWGETELEAVSNSAILEEVAQMAFYTESLRGEPLEQFLLEKHFSRKHAESAYYGQSVFTKNSTEVLR